MVSLYVANTDNEWFDFLSSRGNLAEVNFWQPGGKAFHAIEPGELFAFRLKSPRDKIGGFGVLGGSSVLPLQIAWETFQETNGVVSYEALRAAIARYRPDENVGSATNIGCRILVEPTFFPPNAWIDLPTSWSRNIVGGKRYSTDDADGLHLWNRLQDVAQGLATTTNREIAESTTRHSLRPGRRLCNCRCRLSVCCEQQGGFQQRRGVSAASWKGAPLAGAEVGLA